MDADRGDGDPAPSGDPPAPRPAPKRPGTGFAKPTAKRTARRRAPAHSKPRFEAESLGGRLWHPACTTAARDDFSGGAIPLEFNSVDDYIAVFDPLVIEEAREGLKSDWAEAAAAGKTWKVEVLSVEEQADGWAAVRVRVDGGDADAAQMACQHNNAVVLSVGRPPQRGAAEWAAGKDVEGAEGGGTAAAGSAAAVAASISPRAVAGLVMRGYRDRGGDEITFKIHPGCSAHAADADAPCAAALAALRTHPRAWWLAPAGMLVTSEREYDALHALRNVDQGLLRHLLAPRLLAEVGRRFNDDDVRRRAWPEQASRPAFIQHLKSQYDYKQLEAIEMAACHLGTATVETAVPPPAAPAAPPPPTAPSALALIEQKRNGSNALPKLSFVLIQGPPGTGKTHTVRGVLNVWHLVAFQRHYEALVNQVTRSGARDYNPLARAGGSSANGAGARLAASRPRILVCTPSNAACDELLSRVMSQGFVDGQGHTYRPNVVRVGADDSVVSLAVRERSLRTLVGRYRDMAQPDWQRRVSDVGHRLEVAEREAAAQEAAASRTAPGYEASVASRRLVDRVQEVQRLRREMERLEAARDLVWGRREGGAARRAEAELEALLLEEAEMVFATLSSTQRKVFKAVASRAPFATVLIDEAGQASEVAALQPLGFGARQVVLVGDPQQLPATILSEAAKSVAMERSLFERLQAQGCPVTVLTVQYRMHPEIRSFPSRHFYQDRLEDAPSIVTLPPEPYHSLPLCRPYLVFDVARGKEQRRGSGGSLSNAAEAELAACMFASLRKFLGERAARAAAAAAPPPPPTSVAVVTPYREQRSLLRQTFQTVCGPGVLKEVAIETIDSYQGRQVDVVILSCVRAGASGGLGFVNDVRRMNVAITRARRSLWVLGAAATLGASEEWAALLTDARARGLLVADAHAQQLFPDLEWWERKKKKKGGEEAVPAAVGTAEARAAVEAAVAPEKWEENEEEMAVMPPMELPEPEPEKDAPEPPAALPPLQPLPPPPKTQAASVRRSDGSKAPPRPKPAGGRGRGRRERSLSPEAQERPPPTAASRKYPTLPTGR